MIEQSNVMSQHLACRLTAPIPSAIATIAVRGPDAQRLVWSCLQSHRRRDANSDLGLPRIEYARWPVLDGCVAEQVVLCQVDERTIELHCHGGVAVSQAILQRLALEGCTIVDQATWKQTSDRLSNSSWQLAISAAAESELIDTLTERSAGILLDQKLGALALSLEAFDRLLQQGEIDAARAHLRELLQLQELGMHLTNPWQVVLAGPPNVGKSSLINALSGQHQAIVHSEAGTTRDWVEANIEIDGWPICLTDTAGVRSTCEPIELEGVQRARQRIVTADLVVLVVDSSVGWTDEHQSIVHLAESQQNRPRLLIAWNKSDLVSLAASKPASELPAVTCSALEERQPLLTAIVNALVPDSPPPGTAIPFTKGLCQVLNDWYLRLDRPAPSIDLNELLLAGLLTDTATRQPTVANYSMEIP
jgi:tRNA modification GTPase